MKNLKELFENFNDKNILVVGDVMIDAYLWGKVERISPEAPIPIVTSTKRENRLGGAANVALNIQSLGANPILCGVVGKDEKGKIFLELLSKKRKLDTIGIMIDETRPTTVKTRIISQYQHLLRVDEEETDVLNKNLSKKFFSQIEAIILKKNIHAIVFEDYDKGIITPFLIQNIVNLANKKNIPTLVDPKKRNFNYYKNITLFKPNFKELTEGLKLDIPKGDFNLLFEASKILQEKYNQKFILITLSELGVFICNKNEFHQIPTEVRDVTDVSGAGDTVIAVASVCLACGIDELNLSKIANLAGGLVCEKVGVVPIDKTELLKKAQIRLH